MQDHLQNMLPAFQVVGTDFSVPNMYRPKKRKKNHTLLSWTAI